MEIKDCKDTAQLGEKNMQNISCFFLKGDQD